MAGRLSPAALRLMSDLRALESDPLEGASASPVSERDIFSWNATIFGPEGTPWEGGIFSLQLKFPDTYPDNPPKVRFTSNIFHPNVYGDGTLCLDIIQDKWNPIYTVGSILTSIQSLLTDPNPSSPANPDAARLYRDDIKAYHRKVRACVERSLEKLHTNNCL